MAIMQDINKDGYEPNMISGQFGDPDNMPAFSGRKLNQTILLMY